MTGALGDVAAKVGALPRKTAIGPKPRLMKAYTYALSRFDRKPPLPKLPHGFCPESGTWSPTWLSNRRSAPDWQRFTNLCQTGRLRPGYGGPVLAPARPPEGPVTGFVCGVFQPP